MSTEIKIFRLALDKLMEEVESLKLQNMELKEAFEGFRQEYRSQSTSIPSKPVVSETALLDTKEVQNILGICYNTLQKIVAKGLLTPIKIGQRRIRYSKVKILEYLRMKQQVH